MTENSAEETWSAWRDLRQSETMVGRHPFRGRRFQVFTNMEQWAEIRRRVLTGEISKREACRHYQIHWATLQKILTHDAPPGYRRAEPPRRPTIEPVLPIIERILAEDAKAPRKQRHTAYRIWQRLRDEHGFLGGYTVVKDAVRALKLGSQEVFLPLSHPPGEAQVDWGFAEVTLNGVPTRVAVFVMSLPYSDAVYCQVFPRECTETVLEGHTRAFAFFGGVPRRISYDNTKTAVAAIVGNRERVVTKEFQRLMSHHLFASHFCLVRRPNEKGHVEQLVDSTRSHVLVPVPSVGSLAELNVRLEAACRQDQARVCRGNPASIATRLSEELPQLLPLPSQRFEARRVIAGVAVNALSLVRFDTNSYSVPSRYAYREVTVIGTVDEVRIVFGDRVIARHERRWTREEPVFDPVHDLAVLERKPGGFDCAKPLEHWALPDCFGVLRRRLEADPTPGWGTREFIQVLRLLETVSLASLADAVQTALLLDVIDPASIRLIVEHRAEGPVPVFSLAGRPHLASVQVPATNVAAYGDLLTGEDVR